MSRFVISLLLCIPFVAAAQSPRFAVVDENAVLESMGDYVFVQRQLFETSQKYHQEYDKMSADIDKKFEDYQTLNQELSAPQTIKERRIQEIQNLQKKAQQFLATAEADLLRQETQLVDPIKERVREAIRQIGLEGSYTFILPASQPLFTGIEVEDITELVKEKVK